MRRPHTQRSHRSAIPTKFAPLFHSFALHSRLPQYDCNTYLMLLIIAIMDGDTTTTTIFGIFVTVRRKLTASQVIRLAKPLNISPTNAKSHLTRMVANGALLRSGLPRQSRYWPSP